MSIGDLWQLAVLDAELTVDPLLLAFPGPPPPGANWAHHFPPGSTVGLVSPYGQAEQQAVDAPGTLQRHRVLLYIHSDERVVHGMMRHELEHVDQADASLVVYEIAEIVRDSLTPIYWPLHLAGSAAIYNALPNERDANRASARLVSSQYDEPTDALRFGDHGSLFREPPPESNASLGRRLLAFASLHPHQFEQEVTRRGRDLNHTLEKLDVSGARVWPRLVADRQLIESRRRVHAAIPTLAEVTAVGARPAAAWQRLVDELLVGERRALRLVEGPFLRRFSSSLARYFSRQRR
jgi:hypothetical protein